MLGSTGKSIKPRKVSRFAQEPSHNLSRVGGLSQRVLPLPVSRLSLLKSLERRVITTGFGLYIRDSLPTYRLLSDEQLSR